MADAKGDAARRRAQEQFTKLAQRDADIRRDLEKAQTVTAAKMARLRALRVAKEETERSEAAAAPAAPAKAPRRKRTTIKG